MKRYLISGVSSGIGAAVAKQILDNGDVVVGLGRRTPDWTSSERLKFIPIDLSDLSATERTLQSIRRDFPAFDAVISNAGAGLFGQLETLTADSIRSSVDLNLTAHILLARAVLPQMKAEGQGTLVFIGSEAALQGAKNGAVYCAAKFGLRGLAQSLRADCARSGVRISVVHPGMVKTGFFDGLWFRPGEGTGQALRAVDVASAILGICDAPSGMVVEELTLQPQVKTVNFDKRKKES